MKLGRPIFYIPAIFFCLCSKLYADSPIEQTEIELRQYLENTLSALASDANITRYHYDIAKLDSRLRLSHCASNLHFDLIGSPLKQSRVSVKILCPASKSSAETPQEQAGWKLIRPVKLELFITAVAVAEPIRRGAALKAHQLRYIEAATKELRYGYFKSLDAVKGMTAKRFISAGQVLTPMMLEAPTLVKKGDEVMIAARRGELLVKTTGTALSRGRKGEQILVENKRSKRIVKAIVVARGKVEVIL